MPNVMYLLFRRMRMPLIVLISTYAISVLGFVLIPGQDASGQPWRMDFFHAFYFVSFMGSTIGFGEIPYPFTDGQRLWATFAIYGTVVSWLYAIGATLSMLQDVAFRRVVRQASFERAVRRITEPFYLVCGYGDTGGLVVRAMVNRGMRAVVIDIDPERVDSLEVADFPVSVPGLCADAVDVEALTAAGLQHRHCIGVLALTDVDAVNVAVSITAKLLAPRIEVISRAEYNDTMANLASFGTDHIVNPFDSFANQLALAIHSPSMYLLYEWMTRAVRDIVTQPVTPPRGTWVVCGYGRFGKAVRRYLDFEGVRTVVIEAHPEGTGEPPGGLVRGRGTEAVTLREAHIDEAVGIVAGTDSDANNLSIVVTARELNPNLFVVARQTHRRNDAVFAAANLDMVVQPGTIIAHQILAVLSTPLLSNFLRQARHRDNDWANQLISRISGLSSEESLPETWAIRLTASETPAAFAALRRGVGLPLYSLLADPRDRAERLAAIPLLLMRGAEEHLLPDEQTGLEVGDQLLFCGDLSAWRRMLWVLRNHNVLSYIIDGVERPSGSLWRWLAGDGNRL